MCQNQLPPTVEVDSPPRQQPTDPFDAFPSQHRSGDRERQRTKGKTPFPKLDNDFFCPSDFPPPMVAQSFDRPMEEIGKERGEAICDKQQMADHGGEAIDSQTQQQTEKGANERIEEGGRETTTSTDRSNLAGKGRTNGGAQKDGRSGGVMGKWNCNNRSREGIFNKMATNRMPSTSHGSKSTPTTPSKEICETNICKKHREEIASETIDKRRVTDGEGQNEEDGAKRNAIGKCQNGKKKAQKHRKGANGARVDSPSNESHFNFLISFLSNF